MKSEDKVSFICNRYKYIKSQQKFVKKIDIFQTPVFEITGLPATNANIPAININKIKFGLKGLSCLIIF